LKNWGVTRLHPLIGISPPEILRSREEKIARNDYERIELMRDVPGTIVVVF
jgi:hypothetical protein